MNFFSETFYFVFFRDIDLEMNLKVWRWRLKCRQSLISVYIYLGKSNVDEVSRVYFIINYLSK